MSKRNENARICQDGASNERRVAMCLVEAIDECRAEGVSPDTDPACYLILHQLTHLLKAGELPGAPEVYAKYMAAIGAPGY